MPTRPSKCRWRPPHRPDAHDSRWTHSDASYVRCRLPPCLGAGSPARSSYEYDDVVDDGDIDDESGKHDGENGGESNDGDGGTSGSAYGVYTSGSAAAPSEPSEPDPNGPAPDDDDFTKEGGFCCSSGVCDDCLANGVPHPAGFCGTIAGCADW